MTIQTYTLSDGVEAVVSETDVLFLALPNPLNALLSRTQPGRDNRRSP